MGTISVERLKPGAVLVHDIKDRSGRVLFRAGEKLTEQRLKTLRAWGITEVNVAGENAGRDEFVENPEDLALAETELKGFFRHADLQHPATKELFRLGILYRLKQKRKG